MEEIVGKVCTKCRKWKFLYEYHKDKNGILGRCYHCKECVKIKSKEYADKCREMNKNNISYGSKKCSKCKEIKPFSEFHTHSCTKDGRISRCIKCVSEDAKIYRDNNKEKVAKEKAKFYYKNKDKIALKSKIYRENNKELIKESNRISHLKNREKRLAAQSIYRKENREHIVSHLREHRHKIAKYSTYGNRLTILEDAKEGDNGGLLVRCSLCKEYFYVENGQVEDRLKALCSNTKSENRLYCSDKCKNECDIFRAKATPKSLRNMSKQSRCDQIINRKALLDNQLDEFGYNFCEKCNKQTTKLFIHHGILVSVNYKEADNMAHQILVCKVCHDELHRNCK